jgi:hypothetical protein
MVERERLVRSASRFAVTIGLVIFASNAQVQALASRRIELRAVGPESLTTSKSARAILATRLLVSASHADRTRVFWNPRPAGPLGQSFGFSMDGQLLSNQPSQRYRRRRRSVVPGKNRAKPTLVPSRCFSWRNHRSIGFGHQPRPDLNPHLVRLGCLPVPTRRHRRPAAAPGLSLLHPSSDRLSGGRVGSIGPPLFRQGESHPGVKVTLPLLLCPAVAGRLRTPPP